MEPLIDPVSPSSPTRRSSVGPILCMFAIVSLCCVGGLALSVMQRGQVASAGPTRNVTLDVHVAATKADGSPWDALGDGPDLALCVVIASVTTCYPLGRDASRPHDPECRNALDCSFPSVEVPAAGGYDVTVWDLDLAAHDMVGAGHCADDGPCRVGQATITLDDPEAERRAQLAHTDDVRAHADETVASARATLDAARAAMEAGRFSEARTGADAAIAQLHDVLNLRPGVAGAEDVNGDAITLRGEATPLADVQDAIDAAQAATPPADGADLLAWDNGLGAIAATLDGASSTARTRLGPAIDDASGALRRLRAPHAREVAQLRRDVARVAEGAAQDQRDRIARDLDRAFLDSGQEVLRVEATGTRHTTLSVVYALCGRVWFDRNLGDAAFLDRMRTAGFTRVQCRNLGGYFAGVHVDL